MKEHYSKLHIEMTLKHECTRNELSGVWRKVAEYLDAIGAEPIGLSVSISSCDVLLESIESDKKAKSNANL